ncbi:MAG: PHP domain-containing protein [Rickettsiales bacterium]|jgi:predicted metal-dependent phosphoesterase TrpH|nr:PHP domain-containing protein [Rickettsiales bacterium]
MVDLHTHSYYSDGYFSPREVVERAYKRGVRILSLTDHDTIEGVSEFFEAGKEYSDLKQIVGCETSSNFNEINPESEVHILALGIKKQDKFSKFIKGTQKMRENGVFERIKLIQKQGYDISKYEVMEVCVGTMTNQDIIKAMIQKGLIKNKEDFNTETTNPNVKSPFKKGGFAYYNVYDGFPSTKETIKEISQSGALSVLAHPYRLGLEDKDLDLYVKKLKGYGLDGLECYHSNQTLEQTEYYLKLASKYDLLVSGGSDHHGKMDQIHKEYGMASRLQIEIPKDISILNLL